MPAVTNYTYEAVQVARATHYLFVTVPSRVNGILVDLELLSATRDEVTVHVPHNHQYDVRPHDATYPASQVTKLLIGASKATPIR